MNVFEAVWDTVTARQAAETYGIKIGRSGKAVCPFHNDKNPSLKFYGKRYHCFGCQADGDAIDFTAQFFGLSKKDAAIKLAEDFSILDFYIEVRYNMIASNLDISCVMKLQIFVCYF